MARKILDVDSKNPEAKSQRDQIKLIEQLAPPQKPALDPGQSKDNDNALTAEGLLSEATLPRRAALICAAYAVWASNQSDPAYREAAIKSIKTAYKKLDKRQAEEKVRPSYDVLLTSEIERQIPLLKNQAQF